LTIIYGIYTAGVIAAVFLLGPLSDTLGRKAVLTPAMAVMAAGRCTLTSSRRRGSHLLYCTLDEVLRSRAVSVLHFASIKRTGYTLNFRLSAANRRSPRESTRLRHPHQAY
jgi:hypothetical protein